MEYTMMVIFSFIKKGIVFVLSSEHLWKVIDLMVNNKFYFYRLYSMIHQQFLL